LLFDVFPDTRLKLYHYRETVSLLSPAARSVYYTVWEDASRRCSVQARGVLAKHNQVSKCRVTAVLVVVPVPV